MTDLTVIYGTGWIPDAVSPSLLRSLILLYLTPYDSLRNNHILPINASRGVLPGPGRPLCRLKIN
ncbi:hypothetical protein NUBL2888_39970 [Klebsiella pneumoniae]|nr:hypothetical protein KPTHUN262_22910 [Klebsiella pneumoniae]GJG79152.1 hypothetical protein NIHE120848_47900 [Klebsiella pneumoniae]GJK57658.1 hypothetical protein TUM17562_04700 [Klebsiella pneumoniae]GJK72811.1 hypothetical protein TUM17565_00240 [Klebsiella pneumoniae]GKI45513.1 hypothetical protein NUBL2888_39970 [Klebsiella pneumoniae]